jgi:hypothetical protein
VNEGFLRDRLYGNEIVCTAVRAGRGEPTVMARHPHLGTFLWGFPIIALVWFAFSSVPVYAGPPSDSEQCRSRNEQSWARNLSLDRWGRTDQKQFVVGKAQCPLYHGFFKESDMADPKHWTPFLDNFMDHTVECLIGTIKDRDESFMLSQRIEFGSPKS